MLPQPAATSAGRGRACRRVAIAAVLCLCTAVADAREILTRPDPLARLAATLVDGGASARWLFADLLLQAATDTYDAALLAARQENPSTTARRRKLYRWLDATRAVRDDLVAARLRLSEGADLQILVDHQGEVFLLIDGQPYSVAAPDADAERAIRRAFLDAYCVLEDCSMLEPETLGLAPKPVLRGHWLIEQRALPRYLVAGVLACEFSDLVDRGRKAADCTALASDLVELRAALGRAAKAGHRVDWQRLRDPPRRDGDVLRIQVDAEAFVRLELPALGQLGETQWHGLIEAMRDADEAQAQVPALRIDLSAMPLR